jgi:2'-5' RNA ligase
MKAAIALLSDYSVQNVVRRMVYDIGQFAQIEFLGSLLPAHVSLKQPFIFESMAALEDWFTSLSRRVNPFRVELDRVYYEAWGEYAIVGLEVHETPTLRELHSQINRELKEVVQDPSAPHDGDEYRFHLTVELGKIGSQNPFKQFYETLPEKQVVLSFNAEHIALFFYADGPIQIGSFICYKVLPLNRHIPD